jgi:cardiolipin synthase
VLRFGEERARIAVTSPTEKDRRQEWYDVLSSAIDSAQKEIDIESPYFSDDDLMVHLKAAAKRGVKVRVVMPVAHSESDLFKRLNIETTRQMIGTGVELRAYPGRFSHTKYVCIDDCWTAMGSANCDSRSLHENQENMVMVSGEAFATSAQARVFDKDWGIAQDVTKEIGSLKDQKKKIWSTILEILDYYL